MKKIIISSYDSFKNPFFGGGGGIAIHQVAKRLAKKYDVTVITGNYPGKKNSIVDGITYKKIGINTGDSKIAQIIYSAFLPFYVLTENYDIWLENFTPPFSTGFLQIFTKKPIVGLIHMLAAKDMQRKYHLPFQIVENLGLKTYKKFIVNTLEVMNIVRRLNRSAQIALIGNGVEKVQKNTGKNKYALFLGRLETNQKGLDLLLEAWKNVDGKLIIAGNGGDFQRVRKLIKTLGLQTKVTMEGWVDGIKKDKLFRDAAFVVVPSRFETFSMSALEAFSYALPVISFDIEGLKWMPNDASIKISHFNLADFSKSCSHLFNNRSITTHMGMVGQKYASNFTWDLIAKQYETTIRSYAGDNESLVNINKKAVIKTLTIGIPVYNESGNIKNLISHIINQNYDSIKLDKIIISSDGSTDNTLKIIRSLKNPSIEIIDNSNRVGIARGLNQIIKTCKSDILVTLDGDIQIKDKYFIHKLTDSIINSQADLVSSAIKENLVKNLLSKIIGIGMELKTILFGVFKGGNNIYTCHGTARAYSKRFYKRLTYPTSIANDMYSYLRCVSDGYKFIYNSDAIVWYSLPNNLSDYIKQSTRFFNSSNEMKRYFDKDFIKKETLMSIDNYLLASVKSFEVFVKYPFYTLAYFFLQFYSKMISNRYLDNETWSIATSTKTQ